MNGKQEKVVKRLFEKMHQTYEDWYETKKGVYAYGHTWKTQEQVIYRVCGLNSIISLVKV